MPTVPRAERTFNTNPIPATRLPQAPEGAFGGALQSPQSAAIKLYEGELTRLNQAVTLESDLLLDKGKTEILMSVQEKFRGKEAASAYDWAMAEWGKKATEIENGLKGEAQKTSVYNRRLVHEGSLDTAIKQYMAKESQDYQIGVHNAWVGNQTNALSGSYADPEAFNHGSEELKAVLKDFYKGNPAVAESKFQEAMDKVHVDGVANLLENDQDILASQYYTDRRKGISVNVRTRIEKALEEGTLRGESQRASDAIIAKDLPLADAMEEARAIKDPKLRDEAEKRVKQHYTDIKAAEKLDIEGRYMNAVNLMEQPENKGRLPRDVVPPSDWVDFTVEQRNAIESRSKSDVVNNDKAWIDFISLEPENISKMSRAEFEIEYWAKLDDSHRSRAETLWMAAKESARKESDDADKFTTVITPSRMTEATWQSLGLGKIADNPAAFSQFEQEVQRQVNTYEATMLGGKRKAGPEEIQKIISDIAVKNIMIDIDRWGWFTGTKQVPIGEAVKGTAIEGVEFRKPEPVKEGDTKTLSSGSTAIFMGGKWVLKK